MSKKVSVQKEEKRFFNRTNEKLEFETENVITGINVEQTQIFVGGKHLPISLRITVSNFGVDESFVIPYETGKNLKIMDKIKVNRRLI